MKLLIILSVIACSHAAKLDRTYLPPASASSAGGSSGSLTAPNGPGPAGFGQLSSVPGRVSQLSGAPGTSGASGFGQSPGAAGISGFGQHSGASITSGPAYGQQSGFGQSGRTGPSSGFGPNAASPVGPQTYDQGPTSQEIGQAPSSFGQSQEQSAFSGYQPERPRASLDRSAEILRYDNQNDGETFAYSFETSNGISAEESGVATNGVQAQGGYAYTGDDGQEYRVTYTADENGYQPQGEHLPTPHPIPEEILRSIEENARAAASGNQEGAYNPEENDSGLGSQQYSAVPTYQGQSQGPAYQSQGSLGPSYKQIPQEPQGIAQQYGTPTIAPPGPARSQIGQYSQQPLGQSRGSQNPAQQYGTPSAAISGTAKFSSGQYNQQASGPTQGPQGSAQQYGTNSPAPSGPSSGYNQQPFGSTQGQSAPGQFGLNHPQGQNQGISGYQYNRPQASAFARDSNQIRPSQSPVGQLRPQYRPDQQITGGAGSNSQGPLNPTGPSNFGLASRPGQVSTKPVPQTFGPASGPSNQDAFGPASGSSNQGSFGPASGPNKQGAFSPASGPSNQGPFGSASGSINQGSFGPASGPSKQGSFGPASGPTNQGLFGPASGPSNQGSVGPASGPINQGPSNLYQPGQSGSRTSMPQSTPYQYNRPSSPLQSGSFPGQQSSQPGLRIQPEQGKPGQTFGGPRQPPSFSPEEGYKY